MKEVEVRGENSAVSCPETGVVDLERLAPGVVDLDVLLICVI